MIGTVGAGDLIKKGLDRILKRGRPDPDAPREAIEAQMKELLDEYSEQVVADEGLDASRGVWIFKDQVDHEAFLQGAMTLVEQARDAGRREGAAAAGTMAGEDCACRCRDHGKVGCPLCLDVSKCPVHVDGDLSAVLPAKGPK